MARYLVSLLALAVFLAPSASAHSDLVGTTPADGAVIAEAPASITLQFNEEPLDSLVDVVITDAEGDVVAMDAAEAAGTDVLVPWPGSLGAGDYTVAYRVVSADGHPVTGTFTFTYTGGASTDTLPVIDQAAAADVLADVEQPSTNLPLILGITALVVAAIVIVLVRRRARR
ncbi:MAG: copper resistance protein CopC [Actinomycetota bacterium]